MCSTKTRGLVLCSAVLVVAALVLAPAAFSAGGMDDHTGMGDGMEQGKDNGSEAQPAECQACVFMMKEMQQVADLKKALEEARSAAKAKGATQAVAKIDEALKLVEQQHMNMHSMIRDHIETMHADMTDEAKAGMPKCPVCNHSLLMSQDEMTNTASEGKIVNARCPITGKKIDPNNVPANLTREWNGRKIGFCCPACPPAWDSLTGDQKQTMYKANVERRH